MMPADLGIPLRIQRGLRSVSVGAKCVLLAYSALEGQKKDELLLKEYRKKRRHYD